MKTLLQYAFSAALAYLIAVPVAKFIEQSFADAAANLEQMGKK